MTRLPKEVESGLIAEVEIVSRGSGRATRGQVGLPICRPKMGREMSRRLLNPAAVSVGGRGEGRSVGLIRASRSP